MRLSLRANSLLLAAIGLAILTGPAVHRFLAQSSSSGNGPIQSIPFAPEESFDFDFSANKKTSQGFDVTVHASANAHALSSHGELARTPTVFALLGDAVGTVTLESVSAHQCVTAIRTQNLKGTTLPTGLVVCMLTADKEIVALGNTGASPLQYRLFSQRMGQEGPGTVTFKVGEQIFFDFLSRDVSSSVDGSTYDISFLAREGESILATVDQSKAKIAYATQGGYDVTLAMNCKEFLQNPSTGSAQPTLPFSSAPNSAMCLRTRDGFLVKLGTPKINNGTITIPYHVWTTDGKLFTGDTISWEGKEAAVDFTKRAYVDSSAVYDIRFIYGVAPENGWSFITLDGGQNRTTFAAPWTRYGETTAKTCARVFEYDASYPKFSLMQKTEVVCFLTKDGLLGKIGPKKFGKTPAVQYEVLQRSASVSRRTPSFSREWRGAVTVPKDNSAVPFSVSTFTVAPNTGASHELTFVYNPGSATQEAHRLRVGQGADVGGETRFALAPETAGILGMGVCVRAFDNPVAPYTSVFLDNRWYPAIRVPLCFETANGYMGELVRQDNKVLFTIWRKASTLTKDGRSFEDKDEPDACPYLSCDTGMICKKYCRYPTCAELGTQDCGGIDVTCNGQAKLGIRDIKNQNSLTVCCLGTCGTPQTAQPTGSSTSPMASSVSSAAAIPVAASSVLPIVPSSVSSIASVPASPAAVSSASSVSSVSSLSAQATLIAGGLRLGALTYFDLETQKSATVPDGTHDLKVTASVRQESSQSCSGGGFGRRRSCRTSWRTVQYLTAFTEGKAKIVQLNGKAFSSVTQADCASALATSKALVVYQPFGKVFCVQSADGTVAKFGNGTVSALSYGVWPKQ